MLPEWLSPDRCTSLGVPLLTESSSPHHDGWPYSGVGRGEGGSEEPHLKTEIISTVYSTSNS